jgi:predicted secreted hydrolase
MSRVCVILFASIFATSTCLRSEEGWLPAKAGYEFKFPRDHGSHPAQKIEWWYYTGHLETPEGGPFGYQLTFFRIGVVPQPLLGSPWAVRDLWMTHLAISDIKNSTHHHDDRLNRAGPGFAGAAPNHLDVWNEDWKATQSPDGTGPMVLEAKNSQIELSLQLQNGKPPVIHGKDGLSQKGAQAGNASHYYSLTRMPTKGTLTLAGERFTVSGESWMDHEFGTSFLEPTQRGWDWLSIQLKDGRDLMLFQLRQADGSADPHTAGTLIAADGTAQPLSSADFKLTPSDARWTSPETRGAYPTQWQIEIPREQIHLTVDATFPKQEMTAGSSPGLHYWEGVVSVKGDQAGVPLSGKGYLEMTGYGGAAMSQWFTPPKTN